MALQAYAEALLAAPGLSKVTFHTAKTNSRRGVTGRRPFLVRCRQTPGRAAAVAQLSTPQQRRCVSGRSRFYFHRQVSET